MHLTEAKSRAVAGPALPSGALLLCGEDANPDVQNITRMLDFFAIPWKTVMSSDRDVNERQGTYALLSSVDRIAEAMPDGQVLAQTRPSWITNASAVYVYG